jgi:putative GTP pyrophosphokinase
MSAGIDASTDFDFDRHRTEAIHEYRAVRPLYEALADVIRRILSEALRENGIRIHSIEARAKTVDSFGDKAVTPSDLDPKSPKYINPLAEISDLTGVRIITFSIREIPAVDEMIIQQLEIRERIEKGQERTAEDRFGYQSIHYVGCFKPDRAVLPEYARFTDRLFEIQLRTLLQHAWAEMEHDIQYKSPIVIPAGVRRRFAALAGLLEIADREFQAIQEADERLRYEARQLVQEGNLEHVEITPDSIRSYLDRKLGPDGRMTQWSYDYIARIVRNMGFGSLQQVDECVAGYDDDRVSRVAWGSRQGQISRFEDILLAAMGEGFAPWRWSDEFFKQRYSERLERFRASDIKVGQYRPRPEGASA